MGCAPTVVSGSAGAAVYALTHNQKVTALITAIAIKRVILTMAEIHLSVRTPNTRVKNKWVLAGKVHV